MCGLVRALREVEEETGLRREFESELPPTAFTGKGRLKEVLAR